MHAMTSSACLVSATCLMRKVLRSLRRPFLTGLQPYDHFPQRSQLMSGE
jgi:hypothetical protein